MDKFQQFFKSSFEHDPNDFHESQKHNYDQKRFFNKKPDLVKKSTENFEPKNNQDKHYYEFKNKKQNTLQNHEIYKDKQDKRNQSFQAQRINIDEKEFTQIQLNNKQNQIIDNQSFYCQFHLKNKITNFCLNKECQQPLCPECIKNHTLRHVQNGEQINYETIENIVDTVSQQLQISEQLLHESNHQIKGLQRLSQTQNDEINSQLEVLKEKIYDQVDLFIENYKKEIYTIIKKKQNENDSQIQQFIQLNNKLDSVLEKYVGSIEQNDERLKTITQVLKDDYVRICQDYVQDLQNFKDSLKKEKVNLQFDESKQLQLQKDFLKYLKVSNLHNKKDFTKFDPFSQDNLAESIIVNNQNNEIYKNPQQINNQQPIVQCNYIQIKDQYAQYYNQNINQPQIYVQQPQHPYQQAGYNNNAQQYYYQNQNQNY